MTDISTPLSGLTMLERGAILRSVDSDAPAIAASGKDGLSVRSRESGGPARMGD
jgi:hypothetical protein